MKRAVLLLLCLLWAPDLWAATVFIDPTCANNGDGTVGLPCAAGAAGVGPKNTWVGLTWTAGNTYKGQGGTSETLASYQVAGSGTAGNPITLTSYGTGKFRFKSTTTYAVATVSRSYVTFDGVEFESTATNCLYLTGIASNVIVQNNTFVTCGATTTAGVALEGGSDTADMDTFTITGNTFTDLVGWAVQVNPVNTGNSSVWDSLAITNNTIDNVSRIGNTGAIKVSVTATSTATFTNLTISGNTITNVSDEEGNPVHAIQAIRSTNGTVHEDIFKGLIIANNTLTNGGGGIYVNHVGTLAGVRNRISGNTLTNLSATAGIITFYSANLYIEDNVITGIKTYPVISHIDGIGIDVDLGNAGIIVRRNLITGCLGNASVTNSGQGIANFASNTSQFYSNVLVGNRYGLFIGDESAGAAGVQTFSNNTILNSLTDGIYFVVSIGQIHIVRNNLVMGSAGYGMTNLDSDHATLLTNSFYNNALGTYNSQTAGTGDILTDPLLLSTADYRLQPSSPGRATGTDWGADCTDYRGRSCPHPPDIGAYQSTAGDPRVTALSASAARTASAARAAGAARSAR